MCSTSNQVGSTNEYVAVALLSVGLHDDVDRFAQKAADGLAPSRCNASQGISVLARKPNP